jgi:hypothetical protein
LQKARIEGFDHVLFIILLGAVFIV